MAEIIAACISAAAAIVAAIIGIRFRRSHAVRPLPPPRPLPQHSAPPDRPRESGPEFMTDDYLAWLGAEIQLNAEEGDDLRLSETSDPLERRNSS